MARLEYFLVSKSVSIDQTTNVTSIFEVLEQVNAWQFPTIIQNCVAISLWRAEEGDEGQDFQVNLIVTSPAGDTIETRVNFTLSDARHRVLQRIENIPIEEKGEIQFELTLNGEHKATHIIDIIEIEPPVAPDSSAAPA